MLYGIVLKMRRDYSKFLGVASDGATQHYTEDRFSTSQESDQASMETQTNTLSFILEGSTEHTDSISI